MRPTFSRRFVQLLTFYSPLLSFVSAKSAIWEHCTYDQHGKFNRKSGGNIVVPASVQCCQPADYSAAYVKNGQIKSERPDKSAAESWSILNKKGRKGAELKKN
jgi:hypothetical protein